MYKGVNQLQSRTERYYRDVLTPLAQQYHLEINMPRQANSGNPIILLLGNHSSGKSTFINYLLGESVQKTGIAPTDDGFTILSFSETPEESRGPAAAMRPEVAFSGLDRFGPAFLSRLKLRLLNNELLKRMTLVDSPGMIDAATTAQGRGYDFMSAVRSFGDSADLILFFLDPEKPGTTGETISAFTQGLSGLENKTLILMNKADVFSSMRDFEKKCSPSPYGLRNHHLYHLRADGRIRTPLSEFRAFRVDTARRMRGPSVNPPVVDHQPFRGETRCEKPGRQDRGRIPAGL